MAAAGSSDLVALLRVASDWNRDLNFVRELNLETSAARTFEHESVAGVVDSGRSADGFWVAHEPVAGQRLGSVLKQAKLQNQPLSLAHRVALAVRIGRTLQALHGAPRLGRRGFVLGRFSIRDLFLTYEGQLKLLGLGLARARLRTPLSLRRLPYTAPEVVSGREPTRSSDYFSYAAIVYEMFTGRPAFRRPDDRETRHALRLGNVAPLKPAQLGLDPRVSDELMRFLVPRAGARPDSLDSLLGAMERQAAADEELPMAMHAWFGENREAWQRMVSALVVSRETGVETAVEERLEATVVDTVPEPIVPPSAEEPPPEPVVAPAPEPDRTAPPKREVLGEPAAASADLQPDESGAGTRLVRLARYRIKRRVGAEGPIQSYEAVDPNLDREVDLDVLDPAWPEGALDADGWVRCFKDSCRVLGRLNGPGLPRILDAGRGGGFHFAVFAHRPGRPLSRHLEEGRSVAPNRLVADLAEAMDAVHRAGFVVGSIPKTAVLIRPDGGAELRGLWSVTPAAHAPHPTHEPSSAPEPPELVEEGFYGPASDQFRLGALLYEMLTGIVPGEASGSQRTDTTPTPPHEIDPGVPEGLSMVCMRMMARRPRDRFPDLGEVLAHLRNTPTVEIRSTIAPHRDTALQLALAFAQLCRRVAGISTAIDEEDSTGRPDVSLWSGDVARRLGLGPSAVFSALVGAAVRDLARRTRLPALGGELEAIVPDLAREVLLDDPTPGDCKRVAQVLAAVEAYGDLVRGRKISPRAALVELTDGTDPDVLKALTERVASLAASPAWKEATHPPVLLAGRLATPRLVEELEREGVAVHCVADGHTAWTSLRQSTYVGAVLSSELRGRDALSLLRLCRARDDLRRLGIWIDTRGLSEAERRMVAEQGATLVDPARPASLVRDLAALHDPVSKVG